MLDQYLQDIQGPTTQTQRLVTVQDQALVEVERVGAEAQYRFTVKISKAVHASPTGTCPARASIQAPYRPCKEFNGILAGLGDGTTVTGGASRP
ncbi:hypothetical protein D3C84_981670 [compost metagenome]